ncbi:ankyrin repeat domain-containing protein [Kordiimonas aquimaris]|uniref:ankyrin repeat domain-containing protein n=1 Tax=Kordiimonas aquimaris TaxID=707591 RepID=UPI0021D39DA6|nr:ankyrin repeat domain-containing protein [Kordiimonas aquimaris]
MKKIVFTLMVLCVSTVCATAQTQSDTLFEAAKNNDTQIISTVLDNGMLVDTIAEDGATPLFLAVQNQSYDAVELLIQRGADVNYINPKAIGATPLMIAASRANIDLATLLLDNGAGIDVVDVNNDPAINWAAYYGYTDMVEFLISRGAHTDITGHGTPRQIAIRRGHQDLVELLSDYTPTDGELALVRAIEEEDLEAFEQALADGISPDSLDKTGRPIIGMVARLGLSDFTQALINADVEVDKADDIGFTPLMEAAREGQVETASLLLAAGANANHRSKPSALGFLPMHLAALSDNRSMVELLLSFGADVDPRDRSSSTPMMWALSEGKRAGVIALLANGADPYLETSSGYSSAQMITSMEDEELLGYLKPKQ